METPTRWQLVQLSLDGCSFDQLVEQCALFLHNPLVIIDNTYRIIAHSHCIIAPDEVWANAVQRGYVTLEFAATLNNWAALKDKDSHYERMTVSQITPLRRRFYHISFRGELLGYLNITEGNTPFEEVEEECCHLVTQLLAREMYAQYHFGDARRKSNNEQVLLQLVAGNFVNRAHFLGQVQRSTLNTSCTWRVLCCDLENFLSYNAGEDDFKHELLELFPYGTIVIVNRILVILCEGRYCDPSDTRLFAWLNRYLKAKGLQFGISDPFDDLFHLRRYRDQAMQACRLRRYLLQPEHLYTFFEEVKTYALLSRIPRGERQLFCSGPVLALWQQDRLEHTEYLLTLRIYLQTNRSIKATAAFLHVHRNTINYRIGKIRELFGPEFDALNTANQILLSCQLLQLADSD